MINSSLVESILQALVAGISIGAVYGLMCVGLGMIFSIMRVINFAQGDFMMLGMYLAYYCFTALGLQSALGVAIGPFACILLSAPVLAAFGYVVHRMLISRVSGTRAAQLDGEGHHAQLVLTFGIALILQNGALMLFGSALTSIRTPLSSEAWEIGPLLRMSIFVNKARGIDCLLAIVAVILLMQFMTRFHVGKTLRAAADNATAATYLGIDVDAAHRLAFAIGTGMTAIAGGLLATNVAFQPFVGLDYVIVMYSGVVLGGIGSLAGAFAGGMTIGLVQQLSAIILPIQLQNAAIFAVFLLIVLTRPQGLFGRVAERI
jgi:branched-chain amino acid transport system permease protein